LQEINSRKQKQATILEVEGEVDLYSSPELRKAVLQVLENKETAIIIDLEKVSYMDSSGVATLVEGLQESEQYGGKFAIANLDSKVKAVFELSRLDKVFQIYGSLEEALKNI
jgi:anti-sigma B factor antagonist